MLAISWRLIFLYGAIWCSGISVAAPVVRSKMAVSPTPLSCEFFLRRGLENFKITKRGIERKRILNSVQVAVEHLTKVIQNVAPFLKDNAVADAVLVNELAMELQELVLTSDQEKISSDLGGLWRRTQSFLPVDGPGIKKAPAHEIIRLLLLDSSEPWQFGEYVMQRLNKYRLSQGVSAIDSIRALRAWMNFVYYFQEISTRGESYTWGVDSSLFNQLFNRGKMAVAEKLSIWLYWQTENSRPAVIARKVEVKNLIELVKAGVTPELESVKLGSRRVDLTMVSFTPATEAQSGSAESVDFGGEPHLNQFPLNRTF